MKVILLIAGLVVGAAAGWFTAPKPAAEMKIGDVSLEVDKGGEGGSLTASDGDRSVEIAVGDRSMLADRPTRTAAGGGIIGLAIGFLFGGRKRTA